VARRSRGVLCRSMLPGPLSQLWEARLPRRHRPLLPLLPLLPLVVMAVVLSVRMLQCRHPLPLLQVPICRLQLPQRHPR